MNISCMDAIYLLKFEFDSMNWIYLIWAPEWNFQIIFSDYNLPTMYLCMYVDHNVNCFEIYQHSKFVSLYHSRELQRSTKAYHDHANKMVIICCFFYGGCSTCWHLTLSLFYEIIGKDESNELGVSSNRKNYHAKWSADASLVTISWTDIAI